MQPNALTISDIWAFERSFGIVAKSSLVIVIAIIIAVFYVLLIVCTFSVVLYLIFLNCFKYNIKRHKCSAKNRLLSRLPEKGSLSRVNLTSVFVLFRLYFLLPRLIFCLWIHNKRYCFVRCRCHWLLSFYVDQIEFNCEKFHRPYGNAIRIYLRSFVPRTLYAHSEAAKSKFVQPYLN